ncbi:TM2 domain-containing protein almondex [Phlebotomus argentipes]|uniref:TM2 domain-containing protein almondex n=1 Tax=Phlebotomus argentipes TaxID=94469 RepID=UPI002892B80E|nr:TM2 domain-containing protein almondex [Phlebotomus argentipes]
MFGFRCVRLNIRSVIFIMLSFFLNTIKFSQTAINEMDNMPVKSESHKTVNTSAFRSITSDDVSACPSNLECSKLNFPCISCSYNLSCIYGKPMNVTCEARQNVQCRENREFVRTAICRYCYQTEPWEHTCVRKAPCHASYRTNCTVFPDVLCLGHRTFFKNVNCNWTQGFKWSTALIISITLGGFGVDRFYLGHWQEGIGKLFSFGGLGIWTLIDVILISLHYLGPADGSLYI